MKRILVSMLLLGCTAALMAGAHADDANKDAAKAGKAGKAKYLVLAPHTAEECMKALDDMEAAKALSKWDFGCEDGDHTGYMIVTAASSEDALKNVPEPARANAKAVKLHKFTTAELKSFHEKMKS